jgi:hypothetical protein
MTSARSERASKGHQMSDWPTYPTVYEINTWAWLHDLSRGASPPVTLGSVPQAQLERLAGYGFDGLWLMGIWQRSPRGREIAQELPQLQAEYRRALPDYTAEDVVGSPYAVYRYQVDPALGGDEGLAALRDRLGQLGLRLILDFVPNHLAIDHAWVADHPDRLVQGGEAELQHEAGNYFRSHGRVFAHGRDPNFPGWTDTVQLDYRQPGVRRAMTDVLLAVAERCDGVRCDMAMLVMRDVFLRTWGGAFDPPDAEFWPAAIAEVKASHPGFLVLAEAYWDLEFELQQMGFDFTYDKRLYDRLREGNATLVRGHLRLAGLEYQRHLVRFIENHDEQRALAAFGPQRSQASATVALTLPGMRLVHDGQMEGCRLKLPVQLGRRSVESSEPGMEAFYRQLLTALGHPVFHEGQWQLLEPERAWPGNPSHGHFVAHTWALDGERRLVAVNLAPGRSQCYVRLDWPDLAGQRWELVDLLSEARYIRDGDDLLTRGLYLDMPGYRTHLFQLFRKGPE